MVRFADGDRAAFDPLFALLWPAVRAFVARSLAHNEADDAAQEAIVKIFERIADYDPSRDALSWSLAIASYEVLTVRRRHARRRQHDGEPDHLADEGAGPDREVEHRELIARLEDYLDGVSANDRAAIESELAGERLGDEAGRKRRWRALDRLRRYWRRVHD